MQQHQQQPKQEAPIFNVRTYLEGLGLAMAGKAGMAIPGQPLEVIKLSKQFAAKQSGGTNLPTGWRVASDIIRNHGVRGLYQGFSTTAGKMAGKELYRFPCMIWFPSVLQQSLPEGFVAKHPLLGNALPTAAALTAADVLANTPLDQIQNIQVTHRQKTGEILTPYQIVSRMHVDGEKHKLYRGWKASIANKSGGWAMFMLTDNAMKDLFKSYDIDAQAGSPALLAASAANGIFIAAALTPIDVIKHQITGRNPLPTNSPLEASRIILAQQGAKAFAVGLPQRMLLSALTTMVYSNIRAWSDAERSTPPSR